MNSTHPKQSFTRLNIFMINPLNKFPNLEIYQKKIGIPNNPYTIVNNLPSGVTGTMSP